MTGQPTPPNVPPKNNGFKPLFLGGTLGGGWLTIHDTFC